LEGAVLLGELLLAQRPAVAAEDRTGEGPNVVGVDRVPLAQVVAPLEVLAGLAGGDDLALGVAERLGPLAQAVGRGDRPPGVRHRPGVAADPGLGYGLSLRVADDAARGPPGASGRL